MKRISLWSLRPNIKFSRNGVDEAWKCEAGQLSMSNYYWSSSVLCSHRRSPELVSWWNTGYNWATEWRQDTLAVDQSVVQASITFFCGTSRLFRYIQNTTLLAFANEHRQIETKSIAEKTDKGIHPRNLPFNFKIQSEDLHLSMFSTQCI